ncbi:MAG: CAP domain-containing protein [Planctomycetota bacterium]
MKATKLATFLAAAAVTAFGALHAAQQPTVDEQVLLERINRARLHQADEQKRLGIDFQTGMTQAVQADLPPLIWSAGLQSASVAHDADMWANGYYGHVNSTGQAPFAQVQDVDSSFFAVGQNLGAGRQYATADAVYSGWMVDAGEIGCGHRANMLYPTLNAFGAAVSSKYGSYYGTYWTADFGVTTATTPYVTGVIFRDLNANGQYDAAEGQAHWKVRLIAQSPDESAQDAGSSANAGNSADAPAWTDAYDTGGYALPVAAAGDYTVEAMAPDGTIYDATVGVDSENVKVDFELNHATPEGAATQPGAASGSPVAATVPSSLNAVAVSSSGQKSGCELNCGSSNGWNLLAMMGVLFAALIGLRIRNC